MDKKVIGTRLKELRGSKTQAEVAKAIGVSQPAIALYETGDRIPQDDVKIKIANFFGVTVESIFFAD